MDKLASEKTDHYLNAWVSFLKNLNLRLNAPPPLKGCLEPVRSRRGKYLRPKFFFLCAKPERLSDAAAHLAVGLELLHLASLVHDDLIDDSPKRRGADALWKGKGPKSALLCGDYLFSEAFSEIDVSGLPGVLPIIRQLVAGMVRAELEQENHLFDPSIPELFYWRRIKLKTARFFAVSAALGSTASGADAREIRRAYRFGEDFGMAYQLADDLRDIFTGDLNQGMLGLPVLWLAKESGQGARLVQRICRRRKLSPEDALIVQGFLHEHGLFARAERIIGAYLQKAEGRLEPMDVWNRDRLRQLVNDIRPSLLPTPESVEIHLSNNLH